MISPRTTTLAVLVIALASTPLLADETPEPFLSVKASDFTELRLDVDSYIAPVGKLYYTRTDGLLLYLGAEYRSEEHLHPRLRAMAGWPSARDDGYFQIDVEQPFHTQDSFSIGVSFYAKTAWSRQDDEEIGTLDNNLRVFFGREDFRDYFRREGATTFARHRATPELTFRLEFRNDRLRSLSKHESVWTAFGRDEDWRDNPELTVGILDAAQPFAGKMKSWVGSVVYDSRDYLEYDGWLTRLFGEFSGSSTGGDYNFRKYEFDITRLLRITPTQTLSLMARWGIASGTDFPSHKLFYLGGEGNLRGYEYKEQSGKGLFFGRAEYGVQIREKLEFVYFLDAGQAWYGTTGFDSDEVKYDVGIGFRMDAPGLGDIRIDVARGLEEDADVRVDYRLLIR